MALFLLGSAVAQQQRGQLTAAGREFFVAPEGLSSNDGSINRPLDLATALSIDSPAQPGDTIWVRGGRYHGLFRSHLTGTAAAPIVVRNYNDERVIIDGSPGATTYHDTALLVRGAWTWYWGLEVMFSNPRRRSSVIGPFPADLPRGTAVELYGNSVKVINLIVHDSRNGYAFWTPGENSEIYGSLVYYNGWEDPEQGWGHGVYTHNEAGTKRILDNIIFDQFSHGIHTYNDDSRSFIDNIVTEGNVVFNNGALSEGGVMSRNILHGGKGVARNVSLISNYAYFSDPTGTAENNLGYSAGCSDALVANNYFAGGNAALRLVRCRNVAMTANTFIGALAGFTPPQFPSNTYSRSRPSGTRVFLRPNQYEPGRAHIVVYNWDLRSRVDVDITAAGLKSGDEYEVRDAQNFFGSPAAAGIYEGRPISIPMTGLTMAEPVGSVPTVPRHTAPEFGAFVLLRVTAGDGLTRPRRDERRGGATARAAGWRAAGRAEQPAGTQRPD